MNPRRVIILMTIAVFFVLAVLAVLFFGGIPPWPLVACFAASHLTFCIIISRVKPYKGPYTQPMSDPEPPL
jgi:cell division protein FtsW (lipid II flippase)